jgi:hypothetical protein
MNRRVRKAEAAGDLARLRYLLAERRVRIIARKIIWEWWRQDKDRWYQLSDETRATLNDYTNSELDHEF